MCGIVGLVSFDGAPVDPNRLFRMRDTLTHRGPDDAGAWIEGGVGLGHRRLSIVDLAGGHQPMCNEDGSIWLVFNGEIYNHPVLMPRLQALGHTYRSRCDSETILHLYEEMGDDVVEHLRGMFAFAIWDRRRHRLLLGRDRLGIKPLYVAVGPREIGFGSEIKALLAGGVRRPALREDVLPELLATRFVAGEATCFEGITRLCPGQTLAWSPGEGVTRRTYWDATSIETRPARPLDVEAADVRERLSAAVERHLMSDVPIGVFLSGGIDSSALAAIAAGLRDDPVETFAVGFREAEANELPYARLVAKAIGARHREVVVSPEEFFDALPRLIWQEDEPIAFTSSVPLYFVSALAREHVKVVLTGEGADELFWGYNRYRVTAWNARLGSAYTAAVPASMRSAARRLVRALPGRAGRYASRSFLALDGGIRTLMCENFAVFPVAWQQRILARPDLLDARDPYAPVLDRFNAARGSDVARMAQADLGTYLHELLMKQDQMSMAASIESRVPFLDDDLVAHVLALPDGAKLRGWQTKAVLRAAVRDRIPPAILSRRKMGFPVPFGGWLRGRFWPVVEELVLGERARARGWFDPAAVRAMAESHRAGRADHGERLWMLINLEIWQRVVCEGEDASQVMARLGSTWRTGYAHTVGQDGRPVALAHGRAAAQLPDVARALRAAPGRARYD